MPRASSRSSSSACAELLRGLAEQARRPAPGRSSISRLREPEHERERDEPLLGAVVEVALEPPPLDVARLDDARARAPQLVLVELALGDVHPADEQPRVAPVVAERRRRPGHRRRSPVGRDPGVLELAAAAFGHDLARAPRRTSLALLGGDEDVPEGVRRASRSSSRAARQPLERRVEADDVAARGGEAEEARRRVDDRADEVALVLEVAVALLELRVQALELGLRAVALGELARRSGPPRPPP